MRRLRQAWAVLRGRLQAGDQVYGVLLDTETANVICDGSLDEVVDFAFRLGQTNPKADQSDLAVVLEWSMRP